MHETKFFIDGKKATKAEAFDHWRNSETYNNAARDYRDRIWGIALKGDNNGNHNPHGEVTHLEEAGITLAV